MHNEEIWLLYYRYNSTGRWKRIVGPMWSKQEPILKSIVENVRPNVEYKAVRYVLAESTIDIDEQDSWIDPRIEGKREEERASLLHTYPGDDKC